MQRACAFLRLLKGRHSRSASFTAERCGRNWRAWGARKKSCSLKAKRKLQFSTFADFRKQVGAKKGVRVDHVGGKPEKTDVFRLRLKDERKTAQEGSAQKRTYKTGGERVLLEARLRKVLKRPSRCKNVY